jgi:hypothetical protein
MAAVTCPACATPNPQTYTKCRKCDLPLPRAVNPYAAPAESSAFVPTAGEPGGEGVWRDDGGLIVIAQGAQLPARCVKCNRPSEGQGVKRKLYWHPPAWYLLILISLLIYAIAALIIRKSITVFVGLCPEHRAKRRNAVIAVLALVVAGFTLLFAGAAVENGIVFVLTGLAMLLGAIIGTIVGMRTLTPKRIDENYAHLRGASDAFLSSLPIWEGSMGLLRR